MQFESFVEKMLTPWWSSPLYKDGSCRKRRKNIVRIFQDTKETLISYFNIESPPGTLQYTLPKAVNGLHQSG